MQISNLTKGIWGITLYFVSSCLWAADSDLKSSNENQLQLAVKPVMMRGGHQTRKSNRQDVKKEIQINKPNNRDS